MESVSSLLPRWLQPASHRGFSLQPRRILLGRRIPLLAPLPLALVVLAGAVLERYPLRSVIVRKVETRPRGDRADSVVVVDVVPPDGLTRRLVWQVRWVRRNGRWLVLELRLLHPRALADLEVS